MEFFLLAFPALLSIINPIGGAFVFLAATRGLSPPLRAHLSRRVAIYTFVLLNTSLYIGAYVLSFFGISLPVMRVAGGIIIAMAGWRMLYSREEDERNEAVALLSRRDADKMAFFPLTMPLTAGPGTISVAIALGTNKPREAELLLRFLVGATVTTLVMSLLVYFMYRYSDRLARSIGATGTSIIVRLSSFLLFCIGIQVLWNGLSELLNSL
jgi:multiple antibiotic resistance protein